MKGIKKCIVSILVLTMCLCAAAAAYAEEQEYKEHTVSRGETLWDISSKEITDPFLWPKVWKENPGIKNPDLIYPGQKIKIPLYLLQKEMAPQPVGEAVPEVKKEMKEEAKKEEPGMAVKPLEKKYLVDWDILISSGYIADSIRSVGEISGAPTEATHLGKGDYAYITTTRPADKGDRFYIIRSSGKVRHPETGAMMGYLIDVVGIAETVGKESGQTKVKITASFSEVAVGDLLEEYYEIDRPFLTEAPRTLTVSGYIVATKQMVRANGQYDIVYIDKGKGNGVEVGDVIGTMSKNRFEVPNGLIQVIGIKEKSATAIVRKSEREIMTGDRIGPFAAVR